MKKRETLENIEKAIRTETASQRKSAKLAGYNKIVFCWELRGTIIPECGREPYWFGLDDYSVDNDVQDWLDDNGEEELWKMVEDYADGHRGEGLTKFTIDLAASIYSESGWEDEYGRKEMEPHGDTIDITIYEEEA